MQSTDDLQLLEEQNPVDFGVSAATIRKSVSRLRTLSGASALAPKENNETTDASSESVNFSPLIPENAPVILSWSNLSIKTKHSTPKILLDNISGQITGELPSTVIHTMI